MLRSLVELIFLLINYTSNFSLVNVKFIRIFAGCFYTEALIQRCSVKKLLIEISQNSQENTCARVSFLIKTCNFIKKESLAQVFSCEFCEISKNIFCYRTPPVAAPIYKKQWNSFFGLVHCVKYARIRVFAERIFPYKDRI